MKPETKKTKVRIKKDDKAAAGAHYVDMHVGSKLREKRRELGVSQEELANSVGLTFQQVQKYEKGLNRISCSKLHDFAKYLKTDIRYFFNGLEDMFYNVTNFASYALGDANNPEGSDANIEIADLIKAFQSIKEKRTKMLILSLTQTLAWK